MSTATITADQPVLACQHFAYAEADRVVDRLHCRAYLKQWAGSFKCKTVTIEISAADFKDAAARLAQRQMKRTSVAFLHLRSCVVLTLLAHRECCRTPDERFAINGQPRRGALGLLQLRLTPDLR